MGISFRSLPHETTRAKRKKQIVFDFDERTTSSDTRTLPLLPPISKNMFPEVICGCFMEAWRQIALVLASFINVSAATLVQQNAGDHTHTRAHTRPREQKAFIPSECSSARHAKVKGHLRPLLGSSGSGFVCQVCVHVSNDVLFCCHFPIEMPEIETFILKEQEHILLLSVNLPALTQPRWKRTMTGNKIIKKKFKKTAFLFGLP